MGAEGEYVKEKKIISAFHLFQGCKGFYLGGRRVRVLTSFLFSKWEKTTVCLFVGVTVVSVDLICSFAVQRLEWGDAHSEVP